MPEEKRSQVLVRASPELLEQIDRWRRRQPDLPTRAEALRRLAEKALKAERPRRFDDLLGPE
ncbi:MAG: hypothetical protein AB7J28_16720 [Hyphomonadaceae bacterium]